MKQTSSYTPKHDVKEPLLCSLSTRTLFLLDFSGLLLAVLIVLLLGKSMLIPALALSATTILRIPSRAVRYFALNNYYSSVERELPFSTMLLLVLSASNLGIEDFFERVRKTSVLKKFRVEAEKFITMTRMGKTPEEALLTLHDRSRSEKYKRFLRGLVTVETTSGSLPEYAHMMLKDASRDLSDKWKRYWEASLSIVEIMLVMGIAVITIVFAGALLDIAVCNGLCNALVILTILTSGLLMIMLEALRPIDRDSYPRGPSLLAISTLLVSALIMVMPRLDWSTKLLFSGILLLTGSIPLLHESRALNNSLNTIMQCFKKMTELVRIGYSYSNAIEESGVQREIVKLRSRGISNFIVDFIMLMIDSLQEFGATAKGALETTYFFLKDLMWSREVFRRNSLLLQIMGILLPALFLILTFRALASMQPALQSNSIIHYPHDELKGAVTSIFVTLAVASNILVSLAVEGSPLFTHRAGIALLALWCSMKMLC